MKAASLALLLGAAAPPPAAKYPNHYLEFSEPAEGAHLREPPAFFVLRMNGDVTFNRIEMTDAEGRRWPLRWAPHEDPAPGVRVFIPQKLPKSTYTVRWVATWAEGNDEEIPPEDRKPYGPSRAEVLHFTVD